MNQSLHATHARPAFTPIYETLLGGVLFSIVGGFLDAYTYLLRGEVFCNAQTGNIIMLSINLVQGQLKKALYYPRSLKNPCIGFQQKKH